MIPNTISITGSSIIL